MVKQCTLMEKKEMNMERAKYIFVCGLIVLLAWQNSKLQDKVNMMGSINADLYRQTNQQLPGPQAEIPAGKKEGSRNAVAPTGSGRLRPLWPAARRAERERWRRAHCAGPGGIALGPNCFCNLVVRGHTSL